VDVGGGAGGGHVFASYVDEGDVVADSVL
jgi:hypothetical protein